MVTSKGLVVVKIGSSSLVSETGIRGDDLLRLCGQIRLVRDHGWSVVVVSSGAIALGLPILGISPEQRPKDPAILRAASAVGQQALMAAWVSALDSQDLLSGQLLLAPTDFMIRRRYLKSRGTVSALLDLGVVPVVNENDAIADDEIRFGDNDRLAALVAHLVEAKKLVLLTDTPGLFTADPRSDDSASLVAEITEIDREIEEMAGGVGSAGGTGGMASKLAAARIASWSGIEVVIAGATTEDVLSRALSDEVGVGTTFRPRSERMSAKRLWIAFATPSSGQVTVDEGAKRAILETNSSLLPVGIVGHSGRFGPDDAVDVVDEAGAVFAKGLSAWSSEQLAANSGKRSDALPSGLVDEVIHRDHLIVFPTT